MMGGKMKRGVVGATLAAAATLGGGITSPAGGQNGVWVPSTQPAWLGISYDVEWLAVEGNCESRVVIESVVQGAPADRAGLRPGDALVSVNGSTPGRSLQLASSRLAVGDSVRLRVVRDGRVREVLAVAARRPDRPPLTLRTRGDGLVSSDAPVIRVKADTLVARNMELTGYRGSRGYWIASEDGRAEYRRTNRFSGDAMDRQVVDLLLCASRTESAAPPAPRAVRVDVRELQARADSVREVLVRRSQTRPPEARSVPPGQGRGGVRITSVERDLVPHAAGAPAPPPPTHVYAFSVADHLSAAERGVAGAEVTALEPELAEYFRGVRDGLLVLRVAPGTPADRAGLRPGDVITAGGGRTLEAVQDLRLLLTIPDPTPVELRVVRQGRTRVVTVRRD